MSIEFVVGFCPRPFAQEGYVADPNLNGGAPGGELIYAEVTDTVDTSVNSKAVGASALIDMRQPTQAALVKFSVYALGLTLFDFQVSNNGTVWHSGWGDSLPLDSSSGGWRHISLAPVTTPWRFWRITICDGVSLFQDLSFSPNSDEDAQALAMGTRTVRIGTFRLYADSGGTQPLENKISNWCWATGWRANTGYRFTPNLGDNSPGDQSTAVAGAEVSALIDLGPNPPGANMFSFGIDSTDVPQCLLEGSNNMASWTVMYDDPTLITEPGFHGGTTSFAAPLYEFRYWRLSVRDTATSSPQVEVSDFRLFADSTELPAYGWTIFPDRRRDTGGPPPQVPIAGIGVS